MRLCGILSMLADVGIGIPVFSAAYIALGVLPPGGINSYWPGQTRLASGRNKQLTLNPIK